MARKNKADNTTYNRRWAKSPSGLAYFARKRADKNEQHKKYRQTAKGKAVQIGTAKRMRLKHPEKWSARSKLRYAVKMGRVKRLPCEVCGEPKTHGHHTDYSKPLDVRWLCGPHHRAEHGNMC